MKKTDIIDDSYFHIDSEGIYINKTDASIIDKTIEVWNEIYNFDMNKLIEMHKVFSRDKLADLLNYIDITPYKDKQFVYLEIGCGPAFLGKYLLDHFDCIFVGVDLNYQALIELKKFLEYHKIPSDKYILIHTDIRNMPIKNCTVDLIYGGGVIEHVPDTKQVLSELYRILREKGTCINTVPAFNLFWLTRFFMSIPNVYPLRNIFEYIQIKILKEKILSKFYGYELSFTKNKLFKLHNSVGFLNIYLGAFSFHANQQKLRNQTTRNIFYFITKNDVTCPFYFIKAFKK